MTGASRSFFLIITSAALLLSFRPGSSLGEEELIPLLNEEGKATEALLETLLAPGEFPGRRFVYVSDGDEAQYSVDASLSAEEPTAQLHPGRVRWPWIAGLELRVGEETLTLISAGNKVADEDLEESFFVRWILEPLGQRFKPSPRFEMRPVSAQIISADDGRVLLSWKRVAMRDVCEKNPEKGEPRCVLAGVSREARALAVSPDGGMLAMAVGGLKPRLEIYDISETPTKTWQALFPVGAGGVVAIGFSADGRWVAALAGSGELHRFDAITGGLHMTMPSDGLSAESLPPGDLFAVAGENGEVTLWYLSDGTIAWRLPPRKLRGPVDRIAASGDGNRFATLEYDQEGTVVRVWEVRRRAMLAQLKVDTLSVADIALDEKGERLFVSHEEEGLMIMEVSRKASEGERFGGRAGARCLGRIHWCSKGALISCATEQGVVQIPFAGGVSSDLRAGKDAAGWLVAAAPQGETIAAVAEGHLYIW